MPTKANLKRQETQDRHDSGKTKVNSPIVFPILNAQNCTKTLSITSKTYNMFKLTCVVFLRFFQYLNEFINKTYTTMKVHLVRLLLLCYSTQGGIRGVSFANKNVSG